MSAYLVKAYLQASDGELVHRHSCLVLAIDDLVGHKTGCCDETLCHTILLMSAKFCTA